jgi:hypothetical protein
MHPKIEFVIDREMVLGKARRRNLKFEAVHGIGEQDWLTKSMFQRRRRLQVT